MHDQFADLHQYKYQKPDRIIIFNWNNDRIKYERSFAPTSK